MATPFIGEIRIVGFNFAPIGWAVCNGALVSIAQNDALFALIGTTYGGDGQTTFGLPNLVGRGMIGQTGAHPLGEMGGTTEVTLTASQIPAHSHTLLCAGGASTSQAASNAFAQVAAATRAERRYGSTATGTGLVTGPSGGSQPHNNRSPYLSMLHIIAMEGIFPPQN